MRATVGTAVPFAHAIVRKQHFGRARDAASHLAQQCIERCVAGALAFRGDRAAVRPYATGLRGEKVSSAITRPISPA